MKLGVDYYPEHWPESRWEQDAQMMAELGLKLVRVGEFAWSLLEPEAGRYDFAWLEKSLDILHKHGLQVLMGTPTPTPPPWLTSQHDLLQRDENRIPLQVGSRRHVCANNPMYQAKSREIVTAVATYFAQHPAIIGWQIDNEFGCHDTTRCYCDHCRTAFQNWLRAKYGTLDNLNQAWGTIFWSAIYTDWTQIPLPWRSSAQQNPSLQLDFRRFSSDSWVSYQKLQADILRQICPSNHLLTHNFMGIEDGMVEQQDYFALAQDIDVVSWDNYPQGAIDDIHVALNHDMMRGFKGGKPYWVIEQQPGVVNWDVYNRPVWPGQVRAWSYQGFGHGADTMVFFRWRAVRYGQEQYHMGVLKQDGSPTRLYGEAKQMAQELQAVQWHKRPSRVALLYHFSDWWAIQIDPHQGDYRYHRLAYDLYKQLWKKGIGVDVLDRGANNDLSQYDLVLVPSPILIDEAEAQSWQTYVHNGGKLVMTMRAFCKEQGSNWTDQPLPAHLQGLLGVNMEEYLAIPPDMQPQAGGLPYHLWAELLRPTTATPLMKYDDQFWAGETAVALQTHQAGQVLTLGCWFENAPLPPVAWQALNLNALAVPFTLPEWVECNPIEFADGSEGYQLINHNKERAVTLHLPFSFTVYLDGEVEESGINLRPLGVSLIKNTSS